ncbi:MAG: hypothetical protein WB999_14175, partial [Candidatus Binataceae bacterium]
MSISSAKDCAVSNAGGSREFKSAPLHHTVVETRSASRQVTIPATTTGCVVIVLADQTQDLFADLDQQYFSGCIGAAGYRVSLQTPGARMYFIGADGRPDLKQYVGEP